MFLRFEHLRQRQAKNWELMGPSPRELGGQIFLVHAPQPSSAYLAATFASDLFFQALRDLPRPNNNTSATGSLRHKAIAQVLPPYMIEHDEMIARQRRNKVEAARAIARSVKRQHEKVAASKTRN
jgi:hypothetical protein